MITYLSRLTRERDSLTESATNLAETAAREERDLSSTEQDSLRSWQARCAEIDTQLTEYNAQAESARAYASLRSEIDSHDEPALPARTPSPSPIETRGWGDAFVESDAFRDYPGAGTSRRVEVPFPLEERAAITVGGFPAGALPPYSAPVAAYSYASPLLDVVGKITTNSNVVQWLRWTPNPQAAASVVAEEALKPEAVMQPALTSDALETYAHWKGVSRQALDDIPQIRSTVEGRLRQGIVVALEEAVTAALQAATIPPATAAAGGTLLEAIRTGVATVQAAGFGSPNAVLLNPADWASLDLGIMAGTLNGPSVGTSYWGMRPVAVPALPAGTAYVGNFQTAVTLFSRGSADVFMSDSHADYFIRNVLVILAETRALATVPEPAAAAKCSVAPVGGATQAA